jgi:hypothetical protein
MITDGERIEISVQSNKLATGPRQHSHSWFRAPSGYWLQQFTNYYLIHCNLSIESESESYVTTDGQSASLSWYKAPIRGLRPDFFPFGIRVTVTFLIPWGALSDERTGLSFVCAAGPCQRSLSRS